MRFQAWQSRDGKWWVYDVKHSRLFPSKTKEHAEKSAQKKNVKVEI